MKVLLTGCFGFIGSTVAARLLNMGHEVLGFDNLVNPSISPTDRIKAATGQQWHNFKFYHQDIRSLEAMITICMNEKIESIVHLAAIGSVKKSFETPSNTIDVNERGFSNILCLASAIGVKRIVFASSSSVYGGHACRIKVEGEEARALSPYALSKQTNEKLARIWQEKTGIEYIGLRFFNVYGPGQRPDSPYSAVIPRFCTDKELVIYGDGENVRDFTFVGDVCDVIHRSLGLEHANFCINVGSGVGTSIKELAGLLSKGRPIIYKEARPGETKESIASVKNLQRIYNLKPFTTLTDGLRQTEEYYQCLKSQEGHLSQGSLAIQPVPLP